MNRPAAHIVLALFDVIGLLGVCYVCWRWFSIDNAILEQSKTITVQSGLGFYLSGLVVPLVHIYAVFGSRAKAVTSKLALSLSLFILVVAVLFVSSAFEKNLFSAGYIECSNTQQMTRSEFKTFTQDIHLCD